MSLPAQVIFLVLTSRPFKSANVLVTLMLHSAKLFILDMINFKLEVMYFHNMHKVGTLS